jgi:5-methyltetrahydropteroyltriglutamate--homocysteine methyltransferase
MKTSTANRILTTHVGSIPRPERIRALLRSRLAGQAIDQQELDSCVRDAVFDVVRRQAECGIDVVADGEMGKTSFISYTDERLNGFTPVDPGDARTPANNTAASWDRRIATRREWNAFPEYYSAYLPGAMPPSTLPVVCTGPISYKGKALLKKELDLFKSALDGVHVTEAFVPAIAPGMVGRGQNQYYATEEEYRFAIAEALRAEYRAIVDAGFILQIDDPGLGETWDMLIPAVSVEEYRKLQALNLEALNHALDGIPEERVRYHLCWGSWQGRTNTTSPCVTSSTSCSR